MEIAIVGGGMAGLTTAWLLQAEHEVTVLERDDRLGGQCHTVEVERERVKIPVEAGTRYLSERSHPHAVSLMEMVGLRPEPRRTSLTVVDTGRTQVHKLPPRTPREIVGLLSTPRRLREFMALQRVMRDADRLVSGGDWSQTLTDYLAEHGASRETVRQFMVPFFAAAWGAPPEVITQFPILALAKVARGWFRHHLTVPGGLRTYVEGVAKQLDRTRVRTGVRVGAVTHWPDRPDDGLDVHFADGSRQRFDAVVVATGAKVAAGLLDAGPAFTQICNTLRRFESFETEIAIHGDTRLMPPDRRDWSTCNHFYGVSRPFMSEWSGEHQGEPIFRSAITHSGLRPEAVFHRERSEHLVVTPETPLLQRALANQQGVSGLHLAGMYVEDVDHHESAITSALSVATRLSPRSERLAALRERAHQRAVDPTGVADLKHPPGPTVGPTAASAKTP